MIRVYMGRYEAKRLLGTGGMGRVYLAREYNPDRQVVIKVMHEHLAEDPKFRERFQRETLALSRLRHPQVVKLLDASLEDPEGPCIVMEYVRGVGLDELLKSNKRFTPARVGRLVGQLCDVLQEAHDLGIVHRDLKPSNLMVVDPDNPDEQLKVMDFGLARIIDPDQLPTKVSESDIEFAVGTPGYMSPEQVRGDDADHRADIYSVGVIVYELLAGRLPFTGKSNMDMILAHATDAPPSFGSLGLRSWVPRPVEKIVMKCLEKDPAKRPQSARELADSFEEALSAAEEASLVHTPIVAPAEPPPPPAEPDAMTFQIEAWLPQRIALMKVRGFAHDTGGEIVESGPGVIRVHMNSGGQRRRGFSLFGSRDDRRNNPIDMELRLEQVTPGRDNQLRVTVLFRPPDRATLHNLRWRECCNRLFCEVRAYLMGSSMGTMMKP